MKKILEKVSFPFLICPILCEGLFMAFFSGVPMVSGSIISNVMEKGYFLAQASGGNLSEPLVVISDIVQYPTRIVGGDAFTLIFNLTNVGNAEALIVQFSLSVSYPFAVMNSSSIFSVGNLNMTEHRSIQVQMAADENGAVGVYSIPFSIKYKDSEGESYVQSGTFGTQIFGGPQIQIESIRVDPSSLGPGQGGLMTIRLTNVGTDVAVDATVKVLGGKNIIASSIAHIAKIDSKKSESAILPVRIDSGLEAATYLLNITLTYKDSSNSIYHSSKLFEFKVLPSSPFIPPFYIAIAAGAIAVALIIYFVYLWKPNTPNQGGKESNSEDMKEFRAKHRSDAKVFSRPKPALRKVLLIPYILALFILFLVPYLIHVNLGDAGVVVYSEDVPLTALPEGVQRIARLRGVVNPTVLLVKHHQPEWVTMVLASEIYWPGEVVQLSDYVVDWRVDWRDFNLADRTFDRFAIASVKRVSPLESAIEYLLMPPLGEIFFVLSKIDFYAGPLLLVLSLTMLLQGRLALWNLPAALSFYSFQMWISHKIAYQYNVYVTPEWRSFGYFFFVLLPLTFYLWHFERSEGGRTVTRKMIALSQAIGLSK